MPQDYDEAYSRFIEYVETKLSESSKYLDNYNKLKEASDIYDSLKTYDVDKYVFYADKLLEIDESMKNIASLDNLSFEFLEKNFLDVIRQYKVFENENNIWEKIKLILKQNLQNHN
jgi:hypothetical protein